VIFFCGAGISRARARLPDFFELAERVMNGLGTGFDSPARKLVAAARDMKPIAEVTGVISADRVFSLLEREFTVKDINREVAVALRPGPDADLSAHAPPSSGALNVCRRPNCRAPHSRPRRRTFVLIPP
jgi:hypothetical protein